MKSAAAIVQQMIVSGMIVKSEDVPAQIKAVKSALLS